MSLKKRLCWRVLAYSPMWDDYLHVGEEWGINMNEEGEGDNDFLVNEKCCWRGHIQFAYKEFLKGMSDIFEYDIFQNPMYKTSPN
jgi:hypothetical protein